MAEQVIAAPTVAASTSTSEIPGKVSAEEYMAHYAAQYYEWVEGMLIKMAPVSLPHYHLSRYLAHLLEAFFLFKPIGQIVEAPFVMNISAINIKREPDLQVILNDNAGELMKTYMDGPADICIEVVSPESVGRDYGDKFVEYEKGKVTEYWVIDGIRRECRFHRLNAEGLYVSQREDEHGNYRTPLLPQFVLHVPTLWEDPLPDMKDIMEAARVMTSMSSQEQE